ncbi:MAG: tetratricopeptide repeat protein, partial [Candidatus Latescibacterota bacterium]
HRDIKPDNILIDRDGRVKILDFGVALFEEVGTPASDSSTVGTIHYMSPEQARDDETDARSDVFSLGAILYEILAGRRPFKGDHTAAVEYSILNENPKPISTYNSSIDPELERITCKALAKDPDERYQSAAELAAELRALQAGAGTARKEKLSMRRFAIPGVLLAAAIILLFVMDPFDMVPSSSRDAAASDNILAIMYFENMAQDDDPRRLGEIITNLLITNLSQSQDLKVVSSQRLYDILKMQGKEGAKVIDRSTATEIAKTAGARWMMLGSILQVEPHLIITSQLVDITTGNIEASQRLTGSPNETVFDLVDKMTGKTRTELAVPVQLDVKEPLSIVEVTTSSLDAYRYYLEGLEYRYKYYTKEAGESFQKAIELDSTFAMAHYWYAFNALNLSDFGAAIPALDKAVKYADHASEKEQLYIGALKAGLEMRTDEAIAKWERIVERYPDEKEALMWLARVFRPRDYEKSLEYYQKIIAIDPLNKRSFNEMAYLYDSMGNFEKSIWAINQYIELAPGEANPYDSRGDLFAFNGDIDQALASYQKATEIKADYYASVRKIGNMYLFKGQYDSAAAQYRELASSDLPSVRSLGRIFPAVVAVYQGQLRDALPALEDAIAADDAENNRGDSYAGKIILKSVIYTEINQHGRALAEARRGMNILKVLLPAHAAPIDIGFAPLWAANGRIEQADSVLALYESAADTLDQELAAGYYGAKGFIELLKEDIESACRYLEKADSLAPNNYTQRFWLATAYLQDNRADEAIKLLEGMLRRYDDSRLEYPTLAPRGYYLLGTAYQQAGRKLNAIEQFRAFLEIWKDADPELDEVTDAKQRLEQLE